MKILLIYSLAGFLLGAFDPGTPSRAEEKDTTFTFAFLTDIHLKPEMGAPRAFQMVIDTVNSMKPDFVITGGDLVDDALYSTHARAATLFDLYNRMVEGFNMPVYNTMGNHDIYGYNSNPAPDPDHPEYGEKIFESRIGRTYYSFDHKGWHFMILDGVEYGNGNWGNYIGKVDKKQMEWIRNDIDLLDPSTPIVLVSHIPLISVSPQIDNGPLHGENQSALVTNQREVLALFKNNNLKLVLQGHLHMLEEINYMDQTTFITGGAVCGKWWKTPDDGKFQEGFINIKVSGDEFHWDYVDYGWLTGLSAE